jgi:hypothetical protein
VICTPGNLTAITAQAKVGKSSFVAAMIAASMADPLSDADLLSLVGYNGDGKGLLYIDTEQAPDDFWHTVQRSKKRAEVRNAPDWLKAYTVADLPAKIARKAVEVAMADSAAEFSGLHAVIVDGVADLVCDVNDAAECNEIVAELHSHAIRYECPIICVIHKNPGSDKVRGHLGSQIERKAETNLSLEKENGVTVVWSSKQRRAPIDKKDGPRFAWSDDDKMHMTVDSEDVKPTSKEVEYRTIAEAVLKPGQRLRRCEFITALQAESVTPDGSKSSRTIEKWLPTMLKLGIIGVEWGAYFLKETPTTPTPK